MADILSRRDFLKLGSLLLLGGAYACAPRQVTQTLEATQDPLPTPDRQLKPVEPGPGAEVQIRLGEERSVDLPGLEWYPDTRTSYVKNGESFQFFFSAGRSGQMMSGTNLEAHGQPSRMVGVEPTLISGKYGINHYRAPGTVFRDGGRLWSLDHVEEWKDGSHGSFFTARVGLSSSDDDGQSWQDRGIILDGQAAELAGNIVSGAGQPSALIRDEGGLRHVYMYYTDWGVGKDSIHVARAPLGQIEDPNAWRKAYYDSFDSPALGGMSTPVIEPGYGEVYTALPAMSYNTKLGKYLGVVETSTGFSVATSVDGMRWGAHQPLTQFPEAHDRRQNGSQWYSYPTLLSLQTGDQFVTGETGILIYSSGVYGMNPNTMKIREFNIT